MQLERRRHGVRSEPAPGAVEEHVVDGLEAHDAARALVQPRLVEHVPQGGVQVGERGRTGAASRVQIPDRDPSNAESQCVARAHATNWLH